MAKIHGFCPLHRIAYNRSLDATCPQCIIAGIMPPEQLEFDPNLTVAADVVVGGPVDASGTPVKL